MEIKTLGELCDIVSGGTPSRSKAEFWNEGTIPWIKIGNIKGKYVNEADEFITQEGLAGSSAKMLAKGTVLYTIFATLGEVGILEIDACTNQAIAGLTIKDTNQLSTDYLYYYLRSKKAYVNNVGRGVAQNNINMSILRSFELPLPELSKQIEIVEIIDKVSKIIEARQQELECLDDLIKARFVEMFGEPQINPFHWDVVNISEVVGGKVSNGFFAKRDDYCDDGNVSILGVANIVNRMYSKVNELPKTNANNKDIAKFEVKYGDMLFCRSSLVAEGIGKASIVPEDVHENVLFECHVIRLPLNLNKCVPEFMQTLSTMDFFRNQVVAQSKTATMTTIGQDGILKTDIILPPIEKQKEFYDFVKQVDKSKVAVQKSLDETQQLFDSLMQKYFG